MQGQLIDFVRKSKMVTIERGDGNKIEIDFRKLSRVTITDDQFLPDVGDRGRSMQFGLGSFSMIRLKCRLQ